MRTVMSLNRKWAFSKEATEAPAALPMTWNWVNLPHTWNAIDGQDGDGDYWRGTAWYAKKLLKIDLPTADRYYIEVNGANSSAELWFNGKKMASHDGGYSTWRVDVTDEIRNENLIAISVDNAPNDRVYPQFADFTFYGGLYRNVNLIAVSNSHFDLDHLGGPGIKVTPVVKGADADVEVEVWVTNPAAGQTLRYTLTDKEGQVVAGVETADTKAAFTIGSVHLWNAMKDPYLYTAAVELVQDGQVLDSVSTRFGCRFYEVDPEKGFLLNGEAYPLRGVSRHQDRWGVGNALTPEMHREDVERICEMGATTIRLAHYQHDQYFYDLCDEYGQVIWAEIPYISKHMPDGRANTIQQMKELITQCYNHPSIVVWGLSNEITMNGPDDPDLIENHKILNDLVHEMDKTRLTTMACVSNCPPSADYVRIPDTVSYNHYFGWYGGDTSMNGPWFDKFHAQYPTQPIGVSEYGCEALNWHTSNPECGDYTEEYQAYYHEELIKQLYTRPYLWATHVWNMFDFGCDGRNEGGENGQNHKGLMTFDRSYKKDSFYAYKAWLSKDPFVHLCGKRYIDRPEEVTKVTVYSNLPEVELFANGVSLGKQTSAEHFFYFQVPNAGETRLVAVAGDCRDESTIRKVAEPNPAYRMVEKGAVLNWFDITEVEGHLSLNSKMSEIFANPAAAKVFGAALSAMMPKKEGEENAGLSGEMLAALGSFTVLRLTSMMGVMGIKPSKEALLALNAELNKIPRI